MELLLQRKLDCQSKENKMDSKKSNEENDDGSENDCDSEEPPVGIILALNARLLSRHVDVFDSFLSSRVEPPPNNSVFIVMML